MVLTQVDTMRVEAARAGDRAALDAVAAEYLPLVYNLVRRSLRRSVDVDDVVQETMLRFVRGLGSLRDPQRLRAWLVAVTVNQIREHYRSASGPLAEASGPLDERIPDPHGEFVDQTLIQMDVSDQRRETHQAAQWLDPDHRDVLGLWWLEASGHLSRAEMVDALQADPHHVAVRVNRMKEQLDFSRRVVRALALSPRCTGLEEVAFGWQGETTSVWRKRFARHIRECPICDGAAVGMIPPERLLAGLALLPLPAIWLAFRATSLAAGAAPVLDPTTALARHETSAQAQAQTQMLGHTQAQPQLHAQGQDGGAGNGHRTSSHRAGRGGKGAGAGHGVARKGIASFFAKPIGIAVAAVGILAVAAAAVVEFQSPHTTVTGSSAPTAAAAPISAGLKPSATTGAIVFPSASLSKSAAASHSPSPSKAPATSSAPSSAPATSAPPAESSTSAGSGGGSANVDSAAEQVLQVINQAREQAGLQPYTMDNDLIDSASAHNARMEDGCGLSHQCPGEPALGDRETAAGVQWTAAGENIGEGGPVDDTDSAIGQMAVGLTNSMLAEQPPNDGHRLNILSSSFTEVGIAVTRDSSGTVWMTQDFAN